MQPLGLSAGRACVMSHECICCRADNSLDKVGAGNTAGNCAFK